MSDFTFLYPFWLLALAPLAVLLAWLGIRSRSQTLIAPHLAKAMGLSGNQRSKSALLVIALCWLIAVVALAGPSLRTTERPSFKNASARVLVMDMSMSMYATDIKPNRLTQLKYKATDLLHRWQEGSTGLVAYAGDAYTVSPMTEDTRTITNLIPNLTPELMPYPGADAASGVQLAIAMMKNTGLESGDIVLMTDDLDIQERSSIASLLSGTQWKLSILGVGTRAGAPIQLSDGSLLQTESGTTVVAKANFTNMQKLAKQTDGFFTPVQLDSSDINAIAARTQEVSTTADKNTTHQVKDKVNDGFWLVLFLLVPAALMFRRGLVFSLALLSVPWLTPTSVQASPWLNQEQTAMRLYQAEDYSNAAQAFSSPEWKGVAQYNAGDFEGAIESLKNVPGTRGKYNLANAYAQQRDFDMAIELYEDVLKHDPSNQDAQHNLDVVKNAKQQQQQQQQQQQDKSEQNQSSKQSDSDGQNGDQQQAQQNSSGSDNTDTSPQHNAQQEQPDRSTDQNDQSADHENTQNSEPEQNTGQAESRAQTQPTKRASDDAAQPQEPSAEANAVQTDNQQQVDPELRKLEQVESARDPSRLLRAQLMLQAQQKQPPKNSGKQW
ncbi:vWA domain-containing protein [Vibrio proteolyticus]